LFIFITLLPVLADKQHPLKFKEFSFLRFYRGATGSSLDTTVPFFVKITPTATKRWKCCEVLYILCLKIRNLILDIRHVKEEN
jgi:hypothetical protein